MLPFLLIAVWSANGLSHHKNELQMFLLTQNIDILLISETHFTTSNLPQITKKSSMLNFYSNAKSTSNRPNKHEPYPNVQIVRGMATLGIIAT
jgi:hypothetical protein